MCILFNSAAIFWKSQRRRIIADSLTTSEYIALAPLVKETRILFRVLHELGFTQPCPISTSVDNTAAY